MVSRNITLFQNKHLTGEAFLAHNRLSPSILNCIFLHHILNEAELSMSSAQWPFSRGDNNGRTLVGMAKRWLLIRDLIFDSFLQLFWDFDYWPLSRARVAGWWRFNCIWPIMSCSLISESWIPLTGHDTTRLVSEDDFRLGCQSISHC